VVKTNGFILVSGCLPGIVSTFSKAVKWGERVQTKSMSLMLLAMARMMMARECCFYKLPGGEEAHGAVEEVRAWVLTHGAANKRQRRNN
jgi:hypothetical protein